ncbi:MAG: hypothetical protein ACFFE2_05325 [Candidatus Thorarchaeota archaeon]
MVGENETRYHTPLLLRSGFLHSYKRTIPVILLWLALNVLTYWQMGVLGFLQGDIWTYLFLPLFIMVVHIARKAVSGYDDLFGVLDPEFEKKLKLYKSLDLPVDTVNQERIRTIFIDDGNYRKFKDDVRRLLFHGVERYFVLAIIIASPLVAYFYVDAYLFVGVYGVTDPLIWLYIYIATNLTIGLAIVCCLASLVWIVFSMIMSISKLENYKDSFKISNYIQLLRGEKLESLDRVMGYDTFYEQTTAIGSFIYGLTLRSLIIVIAYALNLIFFSFLNQLQLGLGLYGIGLSIVVFSVILFMWPQLGLHNLLNKRKKEILRELVLKQDSLDTEVMFITSKFSDSNQSGLALDAASLKREASERVGSIYRNVKARSTWGFEITTFIKFVSTSAVPLISTALSSLAEGLLPSP